MTETNDLISPGDVPTRIPGSRSLPGSALAKQALGNLLWRGAQDFYEGVVKPPGQILEGSLVPSMEPGPNMLSIPEYASSLALSGFGAGNLLGGAGTGAARQFGAWHGTGAPLFREFSDDFLRSGEGHMTYGHGHYVAQAEGTSKSYQRGGGTQLMVGDRPWDFADHLDADHPINIARDTLVDSGMDVDKAIRLLQKDAEPYRNMPGSTYAQDNDAAIKFLQDNRHQIREEPVGGMLHINVVPEEHEFLDWDLPFSKQSPQVQQRLIDADLAPRGIIDKRVGGGWSGERTGEEIYRDIFERHQREGMPWDDAWEQTSRDLQEAGIPGNKYLDQQSRNLPPDYRINHKSGSFDSAPIDENYGINLGQHHIGNLKFSQGTPIDTALDEIKGKLKADIESDTAFMGEHYKELRDKYGYIQEDIDRVKASGTFAKTEATVEANKKLLDWIDKEHGVGNLELKDRRTRNFVVFDPKNLEIRTWNGRRLEPVEGDPFGGQ